MLAVALGTSIGFMVLCCALAIWWLRDPQRRLLLGGRRLLFGSELSLLSLLSRASSRRPNGASPELSEQRSAPHLPEPMAEYARVKLLGRGASGSAYLMRRAADGDLCVCKIITLPSARSDSLE